MSRPYVYFLFDNSITQMYAFLSRCCCKRKAGSPDRNCLQFDQNYFAFTENRPSCFTLSPEKLHAD